MKKNKQMKKILTLAVIVVIVALGIAACAGFVARAGGTPNPAFETGTVETVELSEQVEASGSIEAAQDASLPWKTGGVVDAVNVKTGDRVKAGQVLATLAESSVAANILSARVDLLNAQQTLDDLNPTALQIAQAEQAVAATQERVDTQQERVDNLGVPAGEGDIEQARATVLLAKIQLDKAWDRYEPYQNKPDNNAIKANLYNQWAQARQHYDSAVRRLNNLSGVGVNANELALAQADLKLAQADLVDAQQRLADLKAGADAKDVEAVQARITAAQATLDTLQITAPFDGEVLVVHAQNGDLVSAGEPALVIARRDDLHVTALIDESEIAAIQVGAPVEVTLDAFPGVTLTGNVAFINPMGKTAQGGVKYEVRIDLDKPEHPVLLGASADVIVQTGAPRQALVVPVRAIQAGEQGEYVIRLAPDGSREHVSVTTGQLQADSVVVLGDLAAGDTVELPDASNEMFQQMQQMQGIGQ